MNFRSTAMSTAMAERMSARITALCARWSSVAWLCLLFGCGSADAGFSSEQQTGGGGTAAQAGSADSAGNSAAGRAGSDSTPQAGSGASAAAGAGGGPSQWMGGTSGNAAQSGSADSAGSGDVCSNSDACTACLCRQCPTQVKTCESTSGCQAIAECVATSKCTGLDCYCGTADTLSCAAGTANGPCRDVILSAPGGRKPTVTNQSAGPAADAATAVGNCGSKADTGCTASCQ
jgi:hypothetical protein